MARVIRPCAYYHGLADVLYSQVHQVNLYILLFKVSIQNQ